MATLERKRTEKAHDESNLQKVSQAIFPILPSPYIKNLCHCPFKEVVQSERC